MFSVVRIIEFIRTTNNCDQVKICSNVLKYSGLCELFFSEPGVECLKIILNKKFLDCKKLCFPWCELLNLLAWNA
jgi:hypothetical protein